VRTLLLNEGLAPVPSGKPERKRLSARERASLLAQLRSDAVLKPMADCVEYLYTIDSAHKKPSHEKFLCEMASSSASHLITTAGSDEDQKKLNDLFVRAGKGGVVSAEDSVFLKSQTPLFGQALDDFGTKVLGGRRFPTPVGAYMVMLAEHATTYWATVTERGVVEGFDADISPRTVSEG